MKEGKIYRLHILKITGYHLPILKNFIHIKTIKLMQQLNITKLSTHLYENRE